MNIEDSHIQYWKNKISQQKQKQIEEKRKAKEVLKTIKQLKDYLGFRHIVRNIYGFELDTNRLEILIDNYFIVWHNFKEDINNFLAWLDQLKDSIED